MAQPMKVNGLITKSTATAPIYGKTAANTTVNGRQTTCKDTVSTYTQTAFDTTASIIWIKRKATEFTIGLTVASTKVGGTKENSTALELTLTTPKAVLSMDYGRMESALNGSMSKPLFSLIRCDSTFRWISKSLKAVKP
jgi:hypothetical protein